MLPPYLKVLRDNLKAKGHSARSVAEDRLLDELDAVDKDLDSSTIVESTKAAQRGGPQASGPNPFNRCFYCGK